MSIRGKFVFSLASIEAIVFTLAACAFLSILQSHLQRQIVLNNSLQVEALRQQWLDGADKQSWLEKIRQDAPFTNIANLYLINAANEIVAGRGEEQPPLGGRAMQESWHSLSLPYESADDQHWLLYQDDFSSVTQLIWQMALYAALVSILAIIFTAFCSYSLGTRLSLRLKNIALLAKNMKEGHSADIQVDQHPDEIGRLSQFIYDLGAQIKLTVRDLMAAEERFRIAIKAARAGAWKWNMKTHEMYWSVGSYYALGYLPDRDKPTFELWRSSIHPDDLQRVDRAIATMINNQSNVDIEYRIVRPNGEIRWMRSVGSMHFDVQENPDEIYGLQIDITRQQKLQENLREQQSLLRAVLDHTSDSVITLDANMNILMANSLLLYMFQYTEVDLIGRSMRQLLKQDGVHILERYIEHCLQSAQVEFKRETYRVTATRGDGSAFNASLSISGFCIQDDSPRFVVSIANLANERRHLTMTDLQAVPG